MTHKEIQFAPGSTITDAVQELNQFAANGVLAFGSFNGQNLYSDVDDIESAYLKVTGITKTAWDKADQKRRETYQKREAQHLAAIPRLTKKWMKEGLEVLDVNYHNTWAVMVPIRLNDLYKGMELGATLEVVKALNNYCTLQEAKDIIEAQGHSGMSYSLVCSLVRSLCDRGEEFVGFLSESEKAHENDN